MRKFYAVAILMFVLVGCNEPVELPHYEIGFVSQVSRAIVESVEGLYNAGIKIFGTAIPQEGETILLFDAENLSYNDELEDWDYTNTRYWVPQAKHHFCAVWPYATECSFSDTDSKITIEHESGSNGADLLYTTATRNLAENEDYSAVSLSFHHACAALQFSIINASNADVSKVSEIYLVGVKNEGTFTFGVGEEANWELGNSVVNDYTTFGGKELTNLKVNINTKYSLYEGGAIVVLPQEIQGTNVKFHLKITKQDKSVEEKTVELGKLGGSTPTKWEAGKRYEYTLTVKENTIVSNVKVVPWVEHYVEL